MSYALRITILVMSLALISACAASRNKDLNSTLWIQSSAEHEANSLQTYAAAEQHIDSALNDRRWTAAIEQTGDFPSRPVAVVMDLDETVLDNSKYQAQRVLLGAEWGADSWEEWISLKSATAVPGSVELINRLGERGVAVFFVTNRECIPRSADGPGCPQEQETIDNLRGIGIHDVGPEQVLLRNEQPGWTSEKGSRRAYLADRYRILMLFGDDLGDFLPGVRADITPAKRDELVSRHRDKWGTRWFMLSNPIYGSWLNVLEEPRTQYLVGY